MTEYKKIWSSSFRGLGTVVWKFNTKDLFSEASGTGRACKDQRGRGAVKGSSIWEGPVPVSGATGPLRSCPEKGRQVSSWIDYVTSKEKENSESVFQGLCEYCRAQQKTRLVLMAQPGFLDQGRDLVSRSPLQWKQPRPCSPPDSSVWAPAM